MMLINTNNSTIVVTNSTIFDEYDCINTYYVTSTNNYEITSFKDEIIDNNDKVKLSIKKNIGNYSKPIINKKQHTRLVCRRG